MLAKSVVLESVIIGAMLAALPSAAALASSPSNPAEATLVVAAGEDIQPANEPGDIEDPEVAQNAVDEDDKGDVNDDAQGTNEAPEEATHEAVQETDAEKDT